MRDYSIEFTSQTSHPPNWTLADQAVVNYASDGAEFTFAKRFDAPYIWSSFYMLFGRVEVILKAADGTGIVTGAVLMSDCLDEIDWEWSGSNFGSPMNGKVQTNVFGKGITGNYDRGTQPAVNGPTKEYHTYVLDWTPTKLTWSIDDKTVRTLDNNGRTSGNYQYPQTPSRFHLGIWNGGDEDSAEGIVTWVGGRTDLSKAPYTANIRSVRITNMYPCSSWEYPEDFKGTWQECKCTNQTITPSTSSTSSGPTATPMNLPCTYTIVKDDFGYKVAEKLGIRFSALNDANRGLNWDSLLVGQTVKVPGRNCSDVADDSTITGLSYSTSLTAPYANSTTSGRTSDPSGGQSCVYYVQQGDTGDSIAEQLKVSFSELNDANPVDWDSLLMGQGLNIPRNKCSTASSSMSNTASTTNPKATSNPGKYTVTEADTGLKIAEKLGCTFGELNDANIGRDWDNLLIGQELNVCARTPADNTNVKMPSQARISPTKDATALSTVTRKPTNSRPDLNEICVIKSSTVCPSSTTAIYTDGGIASTTASSEACEYTVVSGDSGFRIAENLGVPFDQLNAANPGQDWDKLLIGQLLRMTDETCMRQTTSTQTATSDNTGTTTLPVSTPNTSGTFTAPPVNQNIPYTSASNPGTSTSPTTTATSTSGSFCNQDDCYNNMLDARYTTSVGPFCSMFMAPGSTNVPIATYLGGCESNSERVSSACRCVFTSPPSTSATTFASTGSSSSLLTTASSQTSEGTLGTTATTVVTSGDTVITTIATSTNPGTLGTVATSSAVSRPRTLTTTELSSTTEVTTSGTVPVTTPGTTPGTSTTPITPGSTTGTTSVSTNSESTTGSTSIATSSGSTTEITSFSSTKSEGTTSVSTTSDSTTGSTSSSTTSLSTDSTTSLTTSSQTTAGTSPPTSPPITPPTTPPTTYSTQTTRSTTDSGEWGDWTGNQQNDGTIQGMPGSNSERGNSGQNDQHANGGSGGMGGSWGHQKREAPNMGGDGYTANNGRGGKGSGFLSSVFGGKRDAVREPARGDFGGENVNSASQPNSGSGLESGDQNMPNRQQGRWERVPQDFSADTPGGAQGRGWKRQAYDEADAASSATSGAAIGTVTRTATGTAEAASGTGTGIEIGTGTGAAAATATSKMSSSAVGATGASGTYSGSAAVATGSAAVDTNTGASGSVSTRRATAATGTAAAYTQNSTAATGSGAIASDTTGTGAVGTGAVSASASAAASATAGIESGTDNGTDYGSGTGTGSDSGSGSDTGSDSYSGSGSGSDAPPTDISGGIDGTVYDNMDSTSYDRTAYDQTGYQGNGGQNTGNDKGRNIRPGFGRWRKV